MGPSRRSLEAEDVGNAQSSSWKPNPGNAFLHGQVAPVGPIPEGHPDCSGRERSPSTQFGQGQRLFERGPLRVTMTQAKRMAPFALP